MSMMTGLSPSPAAPIDYSSRDYASLRTDLINLIPNFCPEWTNRSPNDLGMVLIELFSTLGDILGYYIDRVANESYLQTAVNRQSVLNLAYTLDYQPASAAAAGVTLTFNSDPAYGSYPITIPAKTQVSTKTAPGQTPVIFETDVAATIANGGTPTTTVTATQGVSVLTGFTDAGPPSISGELVGSSDGTIDQNFTLFNSPVIGGSIVLYVDEGAGPVAWTNVGHIIDAAATDRSYTTYLDENNVSHILFGDGVNGKVPTIGATIIAQYRYGGGVIGNVGAGTLVQLVSAVAGLTGVTNSSGASGGADVETSDHIRKIAPRNLSTLNRAVTLTDYQSLVLKVPGVSKASAVSTLYTSVQVYVAPIGGGNATTALKNTILQYLTGKTMLNTTVSLLDPTYVTVNVTVTLVVLPQYNRTNTTTAVTNAIANYFALNNVDFGYRVTLGGIYAAIFSVPGIVAPTGASSGYGVVTLLARSDVAQTGTADQVYASNEIPTAGTITVTSTGGIVGS